MSLIYGTENPDYLTTIDPVNNPTGSANDTIIGGLGGDTMEGGAGNDLYYADSPLDIVIENPDAGIDTVKAGVSYVLDANVENLILTGTTDVNGTGNELNNVITGNALVNILDGKEGDDTYTGAGGDDTITDVSGNETYYFNQYDGQDVITDSAGSDAIRFGAGITKGSLQFANDNNNLVISLNDTGDKITITDWYASDTSKIERFEFMDGTFLTNTDVERPIPTIIGTDKKNIIRGTADNDVIDALGGNDQIFDKKGDDTIYGGAGYDKIMEYSGNDYIDGGEGNDHIMDFKGNDTIIGGAGNDIMQDFGGADTYLFNLNDGKDTIFETHKNKTDTDTIIFGTDVRKEDIVFIKKGNDLILKYGETDQVTIKNQTKKGIEMFQLSTGEFLTNTDVNSIVQQISSYAKTEHISVKTSDNIKSNEELMGLIVNSWHS